MMRRRHYRCCEVPEISAHPREIPIIRRASLRRKNKHTGYHTQRAWRNAGGCVSLSRLGSSGRRVGVSPFRVSISAPGIRPWLEGDILRFERGVGTLVRYAEDWVA
jgi:hypothetical protein